MSLNHKLLSGIKKESNCTNRLFNILPSLGQHKNCKSIAHLSVESVLFTVISLWYPFLVLYSWWTTENVSGNSCPPSQLVSLTNAGHSSSFSEGTDSRLTFSICIVFEREPGPTLATLQSETC